MSTEPSDRNEPAPGDGGPADPDPDGILPEYEFRGGERGKYAARYAEGTNVVVLDPDVAAVFPTAEAVNAALRARGDRAAASDRGHSRRVGSGKAQQPAVGSIVYWHHQSSAVSHRQSTRSQLC